MRITQVATKSHCIRRACAVGSIILYTMDYGNAVVGHYYIIAGNRFVGVRSIVDRLTTTTTVNNPSCTSKIIQYF